MPLFTVIIKETNLMEYYIEADNEAEILAMEIDFSQDGQPKFIDCIGFDIESIETH